MVFTRRQRGFTLLEMLVAMSMIVVLAVSMYASLRIGFRARISAERAVAPARAVQLAMDLLRRDLESALPPNGEFAGPFFGERMDQGGMLADIVEFYCVSEAPEMADPPGQGGIRRVQYGLEMPASENRGVLVRRITPSLWSTIELEPEYEVLCRGVRSFALRYWDGLMWQEMWDSTALGDILPIAIEVNLEIDRPGADPDQAEPYRVTRIITLSCYTNPEVEGTAVEQGATETGGATGGATGGGGGGGGGRGGGR